jgi:hypothetical protein
VAAALAGTSFQEETAARAFFAAKHRNPAQPPPLPSPPPEKLLLRPLSDKAHGETFKDALYDGDTPLVLAHHRRPLVPGACSIVHSKRAFKHQLQLFSRGSLNDMDWAGVLLAGGACLAPLLRLPHELAAGYGDGAARSNRIYDDHTRWNTIHYYNGGSLDTWDADEPDGEPTFAPYDDDNGQPRSQFAGSDIDLFLYGLTEEQAFAKVTHIAAVLQQNGGVSRIVRTANAITFQRSWPQRHVQVILRMYDSPVDVRCSFDIDCCACGFDGRDVLVLPRARLAINRAVNVIDPTRESPTYDTRLWKCARLLYCRLLRCLLLPVHRTDRPCFTTQTLSVDLLSSFRRTRAPSHRPSSRNRVLKQALLFD